MDTKPLNEYTKAELEASLAKYFNEKAGKQVNCRWCGTRFQQKRRWQEFCKPACQTIWHKRQKELLVDELETRLNHVQRELDLYKRLWSKVPAEWRTVIEAEET